MDSGACTFMLLTGSFAVDATHGPIIYLNGVCRNGEPVCVCIKGFEPYFWFELPEGLRNTSANDGRYDKVGLENMMHIMNDRLYFSAEKMAQYRTNMRMADNHRTPFCRNGWEETNEAGATYTRLIRGHEVVDRKNYTAGYMEHPVPHVKVRVALPGFVKKCRGLLASPLGDIKSGGRRPWMSARMAGQVFKQPQNLAAHRFTRCASESVRRMGPDDGQDGQLSLKQSFSGNNYKKRRVGGWQEGEDDDDDVDEWSIRCSEANIDYVIRYLVDRGLNPGKWVTVRHGADDEDGEGEGGKWMPEKRLTTVIREYHVFCDDVHPMPDIVGSAPCKLLSWDIETKPVQGKGGAFTQFYKGIDTGGQCITIGCAAACMGSESTRDIVVFQLDETIPTIRREYDAERNGETVHVRLVRTERQLILDFAEYIRTECDPDILIGYNTHGYDWEWIIQASKRLTIREHAEWAASMLPPEKEDRRFHGLLHSLTDITRLADAYEQGTIASTECEDAEAVYRQVVDLGKTFVRAVQKRDGGQRFGFPYCTNTQRSLAGISRGRWPLPGMFMREHFMVPNKKVPEIFGRYATASDG